VVRYSVERRIASGKPDYWDWATLLEIEVLGRDRRGAETALSKALTCIRESFEPETTANNLRLIREARERRNEADGWALTLENELMKRVPPKG
jgi:MAP3K TRAFs-binding domain